MDLLVGVDIVVAGALRGEVRDGDAAVRIGDLTSERNEFATLWGVAPRR